MLNTGLFERLAPGKQLETAAGYTEFPFSVLILQHLLQTPIAQPNLSHWNFSRGGQVSTVLNKKID